MSKPNDYQRQFSGQPLLYPTAVYGIRQWVLTPGDEHPKGVFGKYWPLPQKTAYCYNENPHCQRVGVPSPDCACGIYAYFSSLATSFFPGRSIVGVIEGTGKTLIGERGFKTAHAKVLGLTVASRAGFGSSTLFNQLAFYMDFFDEQIVNLAARWEVPMFADQQDMLREFPLTEPARDFPGLLTAGDRP